MHFWLLFAWERGCQAHMCCTVRFDGLRGVPSGRVPIVPPQAASVEIRLIASGLLNYFWICAANPRFHCRCCTSQHRLDFRLPHFLQHGRPAGHLCGAAGRAEPAGVLLSVARRIHHPRGAGRAGGRSGRQPRGGRPAAEGLSAGRCRRRGNCGCALRPHVKPHLAGAAECAAT